jgi:hypothetical protein
MTDRAKEELGKKIRLAQGKLNKEEIVRLCKKAIKRDGHIEVYHVFSRANREELGKAISLMQASGVYMLDKLPTEEWILKKSPPKDSFRHDLKIVAIAAGFSLLSGYILWRLDSQSKRQEIQQLKDDVKVLIEKTSHLK